MSALRALRQAASLSSRTLASRQVVATRAIVRSAITPAVRAFSVSASRFGEGTSDVGLSAKLGEELQYEKEAAGQVDATPEFLKTFMEAGVWSVDDAPGSDEVTLSRKFGNENIRLIFSIADIQAEEEPPLEDEEAEAGEDEGVSYPIRCAMSITKNNGPGALNVDMLCQDGHFMVDNISFYKDGKLGTELTAEADWKRRGLYIGPQFDTLDLAVQEEFERYMQERGVNETVALFVPEYAEYKEQQEYVKWLGNVKSFIDL